MMLQRYGCLIAEEESEYVLNLGETHLSTVC
ncbi:MAG: hypothetical protein J07HQW2_00527 [Haloquadratum walsbyi J07HQW2]|uniref:Uncharacterized protein n=1 Tax=Haloquadratum walsbyi J07HQW2 TaxID=1238425 RepID=U1NBQ8_9EURY|nr:MAG: hypothetical protein J07HQW2_00527 [Haloquadratum walsbyi J07HQW2]